LMLIADGEEGRVYADGKDRRGDVYLRAPSMDQGQVCYISLPSFGTSIRIGFLSDNNIGAGEGRLL
jgi:hypothetical protein